MAGAAALTSGTARLVAVVVVGVGAVAAWALYDHRTERRRGDSAWARGPRTGPAPRYRPCR